MYMFELVFLVCTFNNLNKKLKLFGAQSWHELGAVKAGSQSNNIIGKKNNQFVLNSFLNKASYKYHVADG